MVLLEPELLISALPSEPDPDGFAPDGAGLGEAAGAVVAASAGGAENAQSIVFR